MGRPTRCVGLKGVGERERETGNVSVQPLPFDRGSGRGTVHGIQYWISRKYALDHLAAQKIGRPRLQKLVLSAID